MEMLESSLTVPLKRETERLNKPAAPMRRLMHTYLAMASGYLDEDEPEAGTLSLCGAGFVSSVFDVWTRKG